jgi:hypothetical protein
MLGELICRRCKTPLSKHTIYHDPPPDPLPQEGEFDVPTSGLYCPEGSGSASAAVAVDREPSS